MSNQQSALFPCPYCPKVFPSINSLKAHLSSHKGNSIVRSFRTEEKAWELFKQTCHRHGLTTCHVLNWMVKAFPLVNGNKKIILSLQDGKLSVGGVHGSNPIIFNITEQWFSKPKSPRKVLIQERITSIKPKAQAKSKSEGKHKWFKCLHGLQNELNEPLCRFKPERLFDPAKDCLRCELYEPKETDPSMLKARERKV